MRAFLPVYDGINGSTPARGKVPEAIPTEDRFYDAMERGDYLQALGIAKAGRKRAETTEQIETTEGWVGEATAAIAKQEVNKELEVISVEPVRGSILGLSA